MIFDVGPFRLYRVEKNQTLDISLICMEGWNCGWEYGWRDEMRGTEHPIIAIRIGKLIVLYLELKKGFLEWWLMGFWGMLSWKTKGEKK